MHRDILVASAHPERRGTAARRARHRFERAGACPGAANEIRRDQGFSQSSPIPTAAASSKRRSRAGACIKRPARCAGNTPRTRRTVRVDGVKCIRTSRRTNGARTSFHPTIDRHPTMFLAAGHLRRFFCLHRRATRARGRKPCAEVGAQEAAKGVTMVLLEIRPGSSNPRPVKSDAERGAIELFCHQPEGNTDQPIGVRFQFPAVLLCYRPPSR